MDFLIGAAIGGVYYAIGSILAASGVFERPRSNPLQDFVYWLNGNALIALWPLWLVLWSASTPLGWLFWRDYEPYDSKYKFKHRHDTKRQAKKAARAAKRVTRQNDN